MGDLDCGDCNCGDCGDCGDCNCGDCNCGDCNCGDCNCGDCNCGDCNCGDCGCDCGACDSSSCCFGACNCGSCDIKGCDCGSHDCNSCCFGACYCGGEENSCKLWDNESCEVCECLSDACLSCFHWGGNNHGISNDVEDGRKCLRELFCFICDCLADSGPMSQVNVRTNGNHTTPAWTIHGSEAPNTATNPDGILIDDQQAVYYSSPMKSIPGETLHENIVINNQPTLTVPVATTPDNGSTNGQPLLHSSTMVPVPEAGS